MNKYKKFVHYGKIKQTVFLKQTIDWKPRGIYFAPGNSWLKINELAALSKNKYKIDIDNSVKILVINSITDVEKIIKKYSELKGKYNLIDWKKISKAYDGIHITSNILKKIQKKDKAWITKHLFIFMYDVETLCLWNIENKMLFII